MNESPEVTVQANEKNFIQKWFGIYFSPKETFESIDRKPDWILPLLLTALITVITVFIIAPALKETQIQSLMERRDMSYEEASDALQNIPSVFKYISPIIGGVWFLIVSFALAGIFFLVFNYVLGGESSYKKVLSVYSYVGFAVGLITAIVKVPLILAKNSMNVQTSLAAFLSPEMKDQIFYKFLSKFDIFVIWEIVLWSIGFGVIYKFSRGKSTATVLSLWGIYIIVSILLGNIFKGFGG